MLPKHSFNPQSTPTASEWKKKHDSFNLHARTPSHPSRESHSIFSTFDSWLDWFSPGNLTRITINENECAPCQHYEHIKRWGDPVTCRCVDATAYVCKRSQLSVRACDVCVSTVCVCVYRSRRCRDNVICMEQNISTFHDDIETDKTLWLSLCERWN